MDAAPLDSVEWLRRARAGDSSAASELVERLYPLAAKIVRAYVPRDLAEEDLLQEVFLRVFGRLDQYRGKAPLEHWVSRLAVSVCVDALRRRRRRRELRWSDLDEREAAWLAEQLPGADNSGPAPSLMARELVEKLLDMLGPDDRVIVTMLDLEQRSIAEVASLVGRSRVAVKVRALRARRRLHAALVKLLDEKAQG
jgi:RNA polymerase sigma-70 factor (ECF subfamily)